jgi:hypothetical protein
MVFESFDVVYPCQGCFYKTCLLAFIEKTGAQKKLVFIQGQEYRSAS